MLLHLHLLSGPHSSVSNHPPPLHCPPPLNHFRLYLPFRPTEGLSSTFITSLLWLQGNRRVEEVCGAQGPPFTECLCSNALCQCYLWLLFQIYTRVRWAAEAAWAIICSSRLGQWGQIVEESWKSALHYEIWHMSVIRQGFSVRHGVCQAPRWAISVTVGRPGVISRHIWHGLHGC